MVLRSSILTLISCEKSTCYQTSHKVYEIHQFHFMIDVGIRFKVLSKTLKLSTVEVEKSLPELRMNDMVTFAGGTVGTPHHKTKRPLRIRLPFYDLSSHTYSPIHKAKGFAARLVLFHWSGT